MTVKSVARAILAETSVATEAERKAASSVLQAVAGLAWNVASSAPPFTGSRAKAPRHLE